MNEKLLEQILFYIEKHIHQKILLTDLAKIAGYSPFYFSKLFTEAMGMPVTSYIRIRKLQYSIQSLLQGKRILEVSLEYAFDSHEGFTRSFTQLFGFTPSTIKKYLTSYEVPEIILPNFIQRSEHMNIPTQNILQHNIHQLVFEVLSESFKEAQEGHCSKINISLLPDNKIKIADNGRGIPLSTDLTASRKVLNKILSGHPITNLEYSQLGDLAGIGLQTVNSLCEELHITVYRNNMVFKQDYIRGVAQHDLFSENCIHESGTELTLKPDREIFGDTEFELELIQEYIEKQNKSNFLSFPETHFESFGLLDM